MGIDTHTLGCERVASFLRKMTHVPLKRQLEGSRCCILCTQQASRQKDQKRDEHATTQPLRILRYVRGAISSLIMLRMDSDRHTRDAKPSMSPRDAAHISERNKQTKPPKLRQSVCHEYVQTQRSPGPNPEERIGSGATHGRPRGRQNLRLLPELPARNSQGDQQLHSNLIRLDQSAGGSRAKSDRGKTTWSRNALRKCLWGLCSGSLVSIS